MVRQRWVRVLAMIVLGAGVMTVPADAAESDQIPGLPEQSGAQYVGAIVNALGASTASKQFFLIPNGLSAVDVTYISRPVTPESQAEFSALPGPPPCEVTSDNIATTVSRVFPVSPSGAPDPFGQMEPVRVRTVAFGSVPSEAVVTISLPRDDEGLPVPLIARQSDGNCGSDGGRRYTDASVQGSVNVTISDVKVDGVALKLEGVCRAQASLDVVGKGFSSGDPDVDRDEVYVGVRGGLLAGTLDISRFTGCVTRAGEDISPLISSLLSGPGNPVKIRQGNLGGCFPDGEQPCQMPEMFDLGNAAFTD